MPNASERIGRWKCSGIYDSKIVAGFKIPLLMKGYFNGQQALQQHLNSPAHATIDCLAEAVIFNSDHPQKLGTMDMSRKGW
jgi:hypothetical protein